MRRFLGLCSLFLLVGTASAGEIKIAWYGHSMFLIVTPKGTRIILDPHDATLYPGEILITRYTDPAWTPLFFTAGALITEIGGVLSHGAVVAREVGLPAIVGVAGATSRIMSGQRVRVNATQGTVELL